jgi:hypothetical protein
VRSRLIRTQAASSLDAGLDMTPFIGQQVQPHALSTGGQYDLQPMRRRASEVSERLDPAISSASRALTAGPWLRCLLRHGVGQPAIVRM